MSPRLVVVWGNCQAAPLAELLRAPLASVGLEVVDVPPVYLADEAQLAEVHRLVSQAAVLVSQPIREEYRFAGCGTSALGARLPDDGRLVTIPTTYHVGTFPYLVNAHGVDGARVDAPLTDYHDLRLVRAASLGLDVLRTLTWWPAPLSDNVRIVNSESLDALTYRERGLDVAVSDLVRAPDALWSMNHPSNRVLGELACRVLTAIGVDVPVDVPAREFLGERRAPVERTVADALGWPTAAGRPEWIVRDEPIELATVVAAHLTFYADRPDVVADTLSRSARRMTQLGLSPPDAGRH